MRRALRPNPCALDREIANDLRESNVGVTSFKNLDEMSSEVRIGAEFALTSTTK